MQEQNGYILTTPNAVENYKPSRMGATIVHIITYLLYLQEASAITLYTSEIIRN